MMSYFYPWLIASRPKTLVAAVTPVFVGAALAYQDQQFHFSLIQILCCVFALLSTVCIQIGTNLFNDVIDFKKGADTSERLGPVRVTQSGLLSHKQVLFAGCFVFFLAVLFAIPLVAFGGVPILLLGLLSLLFGYLYTGGPYPLAYHGLGELFVLLFFGFGAVCGTFYLLTSHISLHAFVAGLQIGCLATVLIAINNLRDFRTDQKANKWTLAARWGEKFAQFEIFSLFWLSYLLQGHWLCAQYWVAGLLPFLVLPLVVVICRRIWIEKSAPVLNKSLALSGLVQLLFGMMLALGFVMHG